MGSYTETYSEQVLTRVSSPLNHVQAVAQLTMNLSWLIQIYSFRMHSSVENGSRRRRHSQSLVSHVLRLLSVCVTDRRQEPSSAEVLGHVADCDLEDFQQAITDADKAQHVFFETTTAAQRGSLLRKWNDLILANKKDRKSIMECTRRSAGSHY